MSTPEEDFESNLSHIRHELRSPLNAIIGYTEMLIGDAKEEGQEDFLSDLRRIHSASMRLLDLIKELLDPAHIGTPGIVAQQDSEFDLSATPGSSPVQDPPVATPEPDREVGVPDSDFSDLVLPESLYTRLREAAEGHSITEIRKSLAEVRDLGPGEKRLAEYLGVLNQQFDMEGVVKVLGDIGHA